MFVKPLDKSEIGWRIKAKREELGLTQEALAERVGVEYPTVGRWEAGIYSPRGAKKRAVADALGVTWESLAYHSEGSELRSTVEALSRRIEELESIAQTAGSADHSKAQPHLSPEDQKILRAYHAASEERKRTVRIALGLEEYHPKDVSKRDTQAEQVPPKRKA